jgi:hypothetical protein
MTETTLVSGNLMPPDIDDLNDYRIPEWPSTPEGESRQADDVVRRYRTLFAHPAVQSVNYWGLTDDGAWLGAPAGLLRADGTRKPSYDALESLIKGEWWLPADRHAHIPGRHAHRQRLPRRLHRRRCPVHRHSGPHSAGGHARLISHRHSWLGQMRRGRARRGSRRRHHDQTP